MRWEIVPPTPYIWLNWYITQSDLYLETKNSTLISFKKTSEESYKIFPEVTQLLDIIYLDYNSLNYNQRHIVASVIYLGLCIDIY